MFQPSNFKWRNAGGGLKDKQMDYLLTMGLTPLPLMPFTREWCMTFCHEDHPFLLNQVFKLMRPGSTVFFSTNHPNFSLAENQLDAADVKEISRETIPEDYVSQKKLIHRC